MLPWGVNTHRYPHMQTDTHARTHTHLYLSKGIDLAMSDKFMEKAAIVQPSIVLSLQLFQSF